MTEDQFQYWYKATVTDIYDADSLTMAISLGCFIYKHDAKIRLKGINAPELRGEERELGLIARDALRAKIPYGTEIIINTYLDRSDKYGRLLGIIYLNGENVNEWLISEGYAVRYME